ncbi:MAG: AraC family transcriptional regulator [Acidobacteriota bacterium]
MPESGSTSRPSPAERAGEGYPWAREREALEALDRMDLDRARGGLRSLAAEVRVLEGTSLGVIALLLGNLLDRLEDRLHPVSPGDRRRLERAQRLGGAPDLEGLRGAFLAEVDEMLAPFASLARLSPAVIHARRYLDRNYTRRVTLREVSQSVHLSPNYLSALFRKETGMTVTDHIRKRRMCLAERLLLEGEHTISEVAYQVGYQNYRDFHRNFVRVRGRSPRSFRRLGQQGDAGSPDSVRTAMPLSRRSETGSR